MRIICDFLRRAETIEGVVWFKIAAELFDVKAGRLPHGEEEAWAYYESPRGRLRRLADQVGVHLHFHGSGAASDRFTGDGFLLWSSAPEDEGPVRS
jgi:hypothetical protein